MRNQYKILAEVYEQKIQETMDPFGTRDAPPLTIPPVQKEAIGRVLDMGYDFSKWIRNIQVPEDTQTKTAILVKLKRHAYSVVEVTPDGLCNGKPLGTKQVREETRPRNVDFTDEEHYEYNGKPYFIEAKFEWEEKAVGHRASIGHHGVTGHDVYGLRPVGIEWIEVTDMNHNVVTDPAIIKDASAYALERGTEKSLGEEKKPEPKAKTATPKLSKNPFIANLKKGAGFKSTSDLAKSLGGRLGEEDTGHDIKI